MQLSSLSVSALAAELDRVRLAVKQPVSTAEPWHVWVDNPRLAEHVDFITVHLLPKQGECSAAATALAAARHELLLLVMLTGLAWTLGHPLTLAPSVMLGIPEGLRGPDTSVWSAVLLIQAIPYAATVLVALISAWPLPARRLGATSPHTSATAIVER
jgi:hypothetical protein